MNTKKTTRSAFTLVEILIVVILLAVLAAIVIPQFLSSTDDAKVSTLNTETRSIRSAISRYRAEMGRFPGYSTLGVAFTDAGRTPADLLTILSTRDAVIGKGPWLQMAPKNPFDNSSTVNGSGGWDYIADGLSNEFVFNPDVTAVPTNLRSRTLYQSGV